MYDADVEVLDQLYTPTTRTGFERGLVGGLLVYPNYLEDVAPIVQPAHIGDSAARIVYGVMRDLVAFGKPFDLLLIQNEIVNRGELAAAGGLSGLSAFMNLAPALPTTVVTYAKEVRKAAVESERYGVVLSACAELKTGVADSGAVCNDLVAKLQQIDRGDLTGREARTTKQILADCLDPAKRGSFVATGWRGLDLIHGGGLADGSLTVIGAGPSIGKTQVLNNIACLSRKDGKPARVLFLSLEMGEAELTSRFLAILGNLNLGAVKNLQYGLAGDYSEKLHRKAFEAGAKAFDELPLLMFSGSLDADGLREMAARYARRYDLLIVDYLQRLDGPKGQKTLDRVEAASRACKDIAVQYNVPVITAASLNREGYRDKQVKPDLANLRECGNIEFDADNAWMLWRDKDNPMRREELELHIRKQRNGPLDCLLFDMHLATGRIVERDRFGNE